MQLSCDNVVELIIIIIIIVTIIAVIIIIIIIINCNFRPSNSYIFRPNRQQLRKMQLLGFRSETEPAKLQIQFSVLQTELRRALRRPWPRVLHLQGRGFDSHSEALEQHFPPQVPVVSIFCHSKISRLHHIETPFLVKCKIQ